MNVERYRRSRSAIRFSGCASGDHDLLSPWEEILAAFAERDDIDFAYPTRRFYDNAREGKPGLVPPAHHGDS